MSDYSPETCRTLRLKTFLAHLDDTTVFLHTNGRFLLHRKVVGVCEKWERPTCVHAFIYTYRNICIWKNVYFNNLFGPKTYYKAAIMHTRVQ